VTQMMRKSIHALLTIRN